MSKKFTVSELRKIVKESVDNFKPKMGDNVAKDNEKINSEAYKKIAKATKDYDGGVRSSKGHGNSVTSTVNKGMSDLEYDSMNDDFKKNNTARIKGYTSANNEKLHKGEKLGNASYTNDKIVDAMKDKAKTRKSLKDMATEIGLTGSKLDKKEVEKLSDTMFEEKKPMKLLTFKNTVFLSEEHMLSRIPDDYKVEGKKFMVKDNGGNSYLVEWNDKKPLVEHEINKIKLKEEFDKIKRLYNYKSSSNAPKPMTNSEKLEENKKFDDMLLRARQLMK